MSLSGFKILKKHILFSGTLEQTVSNNRVLNFKGGRQKKRKKAKTIKCGPKRENQITIKQQQCYRVICTMSVSYTHLDVYKRQEEGRGDKVKPRNKRHHI